MDEPGISNEISGEADPSHGERVTDRLLEQLARGMETRMQSSRRLLTSGFVHVAELGEYHWRDRLAEGKPSVAFRDHGKRLTSETQEQMVVEGMLTLAETKGWTALAVSGSDEFRRAVWIAAQARGMRVEGYQPTAADVALAHEARVKAGLDGARREDLSQRPAASVVEFAGSERFTRTMEHVRERLRDGGYPVERPEFEVGMRRELLNRYAAGHDVEIATREQSKSREEPAITAPTKGVETFVRVHGR
jgi:hypothetical protein